MTKPQTTRGRSKFGLILLAYVAFIALGMPDGLTGVAWPTMRAEFSMPLDSLGFLIFASVAGYMTSSFLNGTLIARMGIGNLLAISCALTGSALIGYSFAPSFWIIVFLGVISGLGAGAIDAGLNTYVAAHFNEGLMQWLHASYGIGVTLGPVIMTLSLTSLNSWRVGYRIVGGFQFVMAACFLFTLPMWNAHHETSNQGEKQQRLTDYKTPLGETLRQPKVWLSVLLFFLYVGAEASLGSWTYSLLTEARDVPQQAAGFWAGSFWATFTVGRILAGLYAKRLGINKLVHIGVILAFIGSVLLWWNPFQLANLLAVALIGIAIAPIFPALMSGTSQRVGEQNAANTIGMQMAATGLGTAVIPSLMGVLARQISLEVVPVFLAILFALLFCVYRFAQSNVSKPSL